MKTKLSDIIAMIFLAPVALLFGIGLALAIVPFFAAIAVLMAAVLPFVIADSAVCYVMGWPNWSERQKRRKAAGDACVRPEHAATVTPCIDTPCCCGPCLPDKLECSFSDIDQCEAHAACKTCSRRSRDFLQISQHGQTVSLGPAWCMECGREYEAFAEKQDAESN